MKSTIPLTLKKKKPQKLDGQCEGHLMGSTVLGERGQLVIPKDIRERFKLKTGAKLLVMNQLNGPIIIFPLENMKSMIDVLTRQFTEATQE